MTAPTAVRLAWGKLHLAGPTGRGYHAICGRTLEGEDVIAYTGRHAARAWRLETVCLDCAARVKKCRATPTLGR